MTFDHELILLTTTYEADEWGNDVAVEVRKPVLCNRKSVDRSEFYNAGVAGYKPELVVEIHAFEYESEPAVEFEGKRYDVIRTYLLKDTIELTCGAVIGSG